MAKFGDYVEDSAPATGDIVIYKDVSATETNRITLLDLWKAFVGFLSSFTAAGTLDGSELIAVSQGGNPRKTTLTDVVALAGGGGTTLPVADTTEVVKGSSDATKKLRFEVDGFTTGTTRVLTPPNYDGTIATLAGTETLSNKTLTTPNIGVATGTSLTVTGVVQVGASHPNGLQYDANTLVYGGGGTTTFYLSSGNALRVDTSGAKAGSGGQYRWANSTDATQAADAGLGRVAAAVVKVTDGSTGGGALQLPAKSATPADPSSSSEGNIYIKGGKLVIQYNDGGTVRYKYLDLTGTGVTWTHTTTAP